MNALGKRTIKVGLTVGLSLGAIVGMVGCGEQTDGADQDGLAAAQSENGLSLNGLALNGLSLNGLSLNGLALNGLSLNGLSLNGLSLNGLSTTSGMMTTNGGRDIVKYIAKCAYPSGHSLNTFDQSGHPYSYPGSLGVAPELENTNTCGVDCQERVSACLLAHVNNAGAHIALWLDSESNIGWGQSSSFPYQEGSFFGNLFPGSWKGYFCTGKGMDAGSVPGRLGAPIASNVYTDPYGGNVECGASNECAMHSGGDGYDSCKTYDGYQWNHVVTVWRNFDVNTTYKICGYTSGTCLGLSSTGAVQAESYTGAADQTWQVLQVSAGKYKVINVSNGKALDVSGSTAVMNSYTGASSQNVMVNSLGQTSNQSGRYSLIPSSGSAGFNAGGSGTSVQTTTNLTMDSAKWTIIPAGSIASSMFDPAHIYRLNPMSAPNSSVDVAYASTANGTIVQEYSSWDTDGQKFNILASGSNWKITMKANNAKCFSPVGNGTGNGTQIEIQDCNGSNNQAWTATNDGTTGSMTFKNVASGRCLDVTGWSAVNGTRMELYDCSGANNQKFQTE